MGFKFQSNWDASGWPKFINFFTVWNFENCFGIVILNFQFEYYKTVFTLAPVSFPVPQPEEPPQTRECGRCGDVIPASAPDCEPPTKKAVS